MRPASRLRTGFLVLVLFTLLAGDAVRYTVGWVGFGVLAVVVTAVAVVLLVTARRSWRLNDVPYPLTAFMVLATASLLWSFYPGATALGLAATWATVIVALAVAVAYRWDEFARGLGLALRGILGLSLLFEFVVSVFVRRPVLPLVPQPGVDYGNLPDPVPKLYFWSRNELFQVFDEGKIQGIVGNSVLLSFVALLGIVVFALQLADGTVRRRTGIPWLVVAVACFVFTRSATNIVGLAAVIVVTAVVLLVRRAGTLRARRLVFAGAAAVALAGGVTAFLLRNTIFALLGKSADLTNRGEIWDAVIGLATQRPAQGWGWVSYWVPWVEPFTDLAANNGVRQLHAHNAWLDIWLQLGILGLVVFGALALSALVRSWLLAIDGSQTVARSTGTYTALSLLPLLLLVCLLVQSVAESKLLVEYGLALLVIVAVKTKAPISPTATPAPDLRRPSVAPGR